jgi:hypothetical protein
LEAAAKFQGDIEQAIDFLQVSLARRLKDSGAIPLALALKWIAQVVMHVEEVRNPPRSETGSVDLDSLTIIAKNINTNSISFHVDTSCRDAYREDVYVIGRFLIRLLLRENPGHTHKALLVQVGRVASQHPDIEEFATKLTNRPALGLAYVRRYLTPNVTLRYLGFE